MSQPIFLTDFVGLNRPLLYQTEYLLNFKESSLLNAKAFLLANCVVYRQSARKAHICYASKNGTGILQKVI